MRSTAAAVVLMAPAYGSAVIAQSADTEETTITLEEITVTARKREESLQDTPVAVSAFTAENIQNFSMESIDDIARYTPGLSFSRAFGRTTERPVIRGAANILAGVQFGVESGTAYFVDGVYYAGDMQALDLDSLERVEVVKGPQSALYGRNTYAGAINFVTRGGTDEFEGRVTAQVAEHDQYEFYGRVSGPIAGEKLTGSFSARYYEYGGEWINEPTGETIGDEQSVNLNGIIDFNPNDAISIRARMNYTEDDDGVRPFALFKSDNNNCFPGLRSNANYDPNHLGFLNPPFGFIFDGIPNSDNPNQYYCGVIPATDVATQDVTGAPFIGVEREMVLGTLKGDFDFADGHTLTLQFGYRDQDRKTGSDSDHQTGSLNFVALSPFFAIPTTNALFNTSALDRSWDYSFEARVQSPQDRPFRWLLGVFYFDFTQANNEIDFAFTDDDDFQGPRRSRDTVENKAIFGMVEYDFTEDFTLTAELRVAEETKTLQQFATAISTATFDGEATFDSVAPRFIANYRFNDAVSMYANYAKGIKPGGLNGATGLEVDRENYDEEESDNYEVGLKADWFGGRLRTNIAAFLTQTNNYQLTTAVAAPGTNAVTSLVTNQGDAEIKGIEIDARAAITEDLEIGGTYALTDAEFTEGCDAFQYVLTSGGFQMSATPNVPAVADAPVLPGADCSIAGNQIPMTSRHMASAFIQYERPVHENFNFFFITDFSHESSKFVQVHNGSETGDANILGFRTGIRGATWELAVFGRNITDEDAIPVATRWFDVRQGFNTVAPEVGADNTFLGPRAPFASFRRGAQFGFQLSYDF